MENQSIEVADILRLYGDQYRNRYRPSPQQSKVMNLIKICRTSVLGGHMQQCDHCGHQQPAYNSCRNRHCPKCQSGAKQKWLNARSAELLPCGYFHLVFTLPHDLNVLILANKALLLAMLFATVKEVLQCFAKDRQWRLEGQIGFVGVLHTWSQTMMDHFHLHCLVPAGALQPKKPRWIAARKKYLFGQKQMAKAFKHRYMKKLCRLYETDQLVFAGRACELAGAQGYGKLVAELKKKNWIVYAKRPFAGPEQVLDYLGRYTHRVAISNHRIVSLENDRVTFTYRDRGDEDKIKHMTLDAVEFIRRFLLHVLPDRFVKIRYFGFMAHRNRGKSIALIRRLLDPHGQAVEIRQETVVEMMIRVTGIDISRCPRCGKGTLQRTHPVPTKARDPTRQAQPVMP
jgi:hypothetical protein